MDAEETIFATALQLPPEERGPYLDQAVGREGASRRRVESLLRCSGPADGFLEQPAAPQARAASLHAIAPAEKPGDLIGCYKLLEQIGEGGCGVVYMAEQEQPLRRRVALKVIKLGMDTKQVVARFEAERQALAMMDHPNIAKVIEAGATETGRPYFVMELVRGIKITEYCDQNNLTTKERLDLFAQVCRAIQHAHQKGIIHRDIKPSNILVTLHDGLPVPKVIDFGIAKATQGRLTDQTLFTAFQQFIGTPAYMSPEQAEMSGLDIDTRSDIYSLGVLLYELLTGKTPFDGTELLAAGLDGMRRTIRETEPTKPSTRLTQELAGADVVGRVAPRAPSSTENAPVGGAHGVTRPTSRPPTLNSQKLKELIYLLRGDLDWIVMRCLEKDRTRRYETANGLASDIQRHLDHEPVLACPPSNLYRFQKLVRRNKLAFAAGMSVVAALVVGLSIATWMFFKERVAVREQSRLRLQAQTEAAKSKQVAQFLKDMLDGVEPSVALGRDTAMLREILDRTADRIGQDLTNRPEVEAELQTTIGGVYLELGQYDKAEEILRKALTLRRQLFGDNNLEVAESLHNLASALWHQARLDRAKLAESERFQREALAIRRRILGNEHTNVLVSLNDLGNILSSQGKLQEAEAMHREGIALRKKLKGADDHNMAVSLNNLAGLLKQQGKLPEAETMLRDGLDLLRKLHQADGPDGAKLLTNLGQLQTDAGKRPEAEATLRAVLALERKLLGEAHPITILTLDHLGQNLAAQARFVEAEDIFREALAIQRRTSAVKESLAVAVVINDLARTLQRNPKKLAEAETLLRESLNITRKLTPDDSLGQAENLSMLGAVLHLEARPAEAEAADNQAELLYNKVLSSSASDKPESAEFLDAHCAFLASRGRWKEAAADCAKTIELLPSSAGRCHQLAALLVTLGDVEGYRRLCQRMVARFADTKDRHTAERTAMACLILPSSGTDLGLIAGLTERAHKLRETSYTDLIKGLAELRRGSYASAIELTKKSFELPSPEADNRDLLGYMVLAMAQYRMGKLEESRAAWTKGSQHAQSKLPRLDSGYLGASWQHLLIAYALMKEAKILIEGGAETSGEFK